MKRGAALVSLLACGLAGAIFALSLAVTPVAGADGGTTGTAPTTPTEPPTTTAPSPTTTTPAPPAQLIAPGVTVGRVEVGGLSAAQAREAVSAAFARPLTLVVSPTRRIRVAPHDLGAMPQLGAAIGRALTIRRARFNVPLPVEVSEARLERYVQSLGRQLDRAPVDSRLILYELAPRITKDHRGRHLNRVLTARALVLALKTQDRTPIALPFRPVVPAVTHTSFGQVVVIRRGTHELRLYRGVALVRRFPVATGQSSYPTPLGRFEVVTKWRDPWWYPPAGSAWAAGKKPIPPGPGNPLGTRWLGLSAPYVGIHGTPDAASIGYSASHGCIRMRIADAEWLFDRVEVGTTVFIVPA